MTAANDRKLWAAIGVSLLLHAVLLSLHFRFPEASRVLRSKALDIILVNARSERKPTDAQALAQANLNGGGSSEDDVRAMTPLPPSPQQRTGDELEQAQKRARELETRQRQLLTQTAPNRKALPLPKPERPLPEPMPQVLPEPPLSGRDLADSALAMARLQAQIDRQISDYNKRPRVQFIGVRTEEYRFAQYMEDWRAKIERVGTLNYPEAARGKFSGSLVLTVRVKSDGSVERVEIDRPSRYRVLDEAAQRIVRMASPFAKFPPAISRDTDVLEITRTWTFTSSNQLGIKRE